MSRARQLIEQFLREDFSEHDLNELQRLTSEHNGSIVMRRGNSWILVCFKSAEGLAAGKTALRGTGLKTQSAQYQGSLRNLGYSFDPMLSLIVTK